jgi:hypothetical protein
MAKEEAKPDRRTGRERSICMCWDGDSRRMVASLHQNSADAMDWTDVASHPMLAMGMPAMCKVVGVWRRCICELF